MHLLYDGLVYGTQYKKLLDELKEVGIRHVRDGVCSICTSANQRFEYYGKNGIRFSFIVGQGIGRNATSDTIPARMAMIKSQLLPYTESVENVNEPDLQNEPNWVQETRAQAQQLHQIVRGDPALSRLKILTASIGHNNNWPQVGDIGNWADAVNVHYYTGGLVPEEVTKNLPLTMMANNPGKPVFLTETGYHNATNNNQWWAPNGHKPTSEAAEAIYLPRTYLETFRAGVKRTFKYEFINQRPDLSWAPLVDTESHFGMLRNDLSRKPVFYSVRNLLRILADPQPASPASLDYSLNGDTGKVKHLLLHKSNGRFYLVLWSTESIWNSTTRVAIADQPKQVQLRLPESFRVTEYRPLNSDQGADRGKVSRLDLTVRADPSIIEITPPPSSTSPNSPSQPDRPGGIQEPQKDEGGSDKKQPQGGQKDGPRLRLVRPQPLQLVRGGRLSWSVQLTGAQAREVRFLVSGRVASRDRKAPYASAAKLSYHESRRVKVQAVAVLANGKKVKSQTVSVRVQARKP